MTFTADHYAQMAQGYDEAAADPRVTPERKSEFVKKAEWFHFLAQRERETGRMETDRAKGNAGPVNRDIDVESDSSPQRRSMAPFLTMLWLTGAVLYLLSTLLFTSAANLVGDEDGPGAVTEASRPAEPLPKVADAGDIKANERDNRQVQPAADRRHAISPDQPAYEAPTLTAPPASVSDPELPSPPEPIQDAAGGQPGEVLTVTANATIRSGPSATSKKIGNATPGAELQVKARDTGWVQFLDPSTGNSGWIHASLVAPRSGAESLAASREGEIPALEPLEQKPAKKRAEPKPRAPAQVTEQQWRYVDLPHDDEFLPARRRPGLLAKRRMLREGLMSPGFFPPR